MVAKKSKSKQGVRSLRPSEIADQLEHAFLAGLGALTNPQDIGSKSFESLVKDGESFRKKATDRTEELIDDVQEAIRDMSGDAQSKASGLLEHMRDASQLDKLNSAFDSRVAGAMNRLGVASKRDVDALNRKLDKIIKAVEETKAPARPKAPAKATSKKKTAKRSTKKAAKPATKKTAKRSTKKKVSRKKA